MYVQYVIGCAGECYKRRNNRRRNAFAMEREQVPLWQKLTYTVYLRVAIIVASGLALFAAAIALNAARDEDDPAFVVEWSQRPGEWNFKHETFAVTGTTIAASAVTIIVQTAFAALMRWGQHIILYDLDDGIRFCIHLVDFIASSVLLEGTLAGAVASSVVAYQLAGDGELYRNTKDNLYKPVSGSVAFGFLSALLLSVLFIWSSCTLCSLKKTCCNRSSRRKLSSSVSPV